MREKLYELIRDCDCGCSGCDGCKYEADEAECISHMAYQMTDHLIANGVSLRPKGEWIKHWCDNNMIGHEWEECSRCGCSMVDTNQFWDSCFCPNCGADMRGNPNDS